MHASTPTLTDLLHVSPPIAGASKRCRACGNVKPISEMKKHNGSSDGYSKICKPCHKIETAAWKAANRDKQNTYQRSYSQTEKGRAAASRANHSRRAALVEARSEAWDRFEIYDRDNGICHHCKLPVPRDDFHADHLYPLKHANRFGAQVMGDRALNLAPAHESCNLERSNLIIAHDKLIELSLPGFEKAVRGFSKYMEQLQNVV